METFHTELAWLVTFATCDLHATSKIDELLLLIFSVQVLSDFDRAFTSKLIISQVHIKKLNYVKYGMNI